MMPMRRQILTLLPLTVLAACATAPKQALRVNVAGVERVAGAAMELRFMARLRIQNPNDGAIDYSGVFVDLQLRGKSIGTGVTDGRGTVSGHGQVLVDVPVTVTALGEVRQAIGLYGAPDRKLDVVLKGQLAGSGYGDLPFEWRGELSMPLPAGS